ncbi:class I SAM-dependent methyltransferase [Streptomyces durhamensis]|uniref:class I SAM-dependent methyltransferase n=1 Tax=Streptomyces durhamensis TaxID=68194 RepID=UPI00099DD169|nr:class I SAM-dependent methyltransferase [Streptomyces durhamensis]
MRYRCTSPTAEESVSEILPRVAGWLTPAQAAILSELASRIPVGTHIVEFGSFLGRSTLSLLSGASEDVTLYAVDPYAGDEVGPRPGRTAHSGVDPETTHLEFHKNLGLAGAEGRVTHLRIRSEQTPDDVLEGAGLVFVDGSHRFRDAAQDLRRVCGRLTPGGWLAVHDAFYSVGVTLAITTVLLRRPDFTYRGRSGSLAVYRRTGRGPDGGGARPSRGNRLRQVAELPTLGGVCVRKTGLLIAAACSAGDIDARWPH